MPTFDVEVFEHRRTSVTVDAATIDEARALVLADIRTNGQTGLLETATWEQTRQGVADGNTLYPA